MITRFLLSSLFIVLAFGVLLSRVALERVAYGAGGYSRPRRFACFVLGYRLRVCQLPLETLLSDALALVWGLVCALLLMVGILGFISLI